MNNQQMAALRNIVRDNEKYLQFLGYVEVDVELLSLDKLLNCYICYCFVIIMFSWAYCTQTVQKDPVAVVVAPGFIDD